MFLARLLGREKQRCVLNGLKQVRYWSQKAIEVETFDPSFKLRLSTNEPKKPTREPFAKNLFAGKVDTEFLAYPEAQSHSRHLEFAEWIKQIQDYLEKNLDVQEIDQTGIIKEEVMDGLKKLGIFKAAVSTDYGGLGLNYTEYARLVETVSVVPVLGSYLINHANAVNLLTKLGTETQKAEILPKIVSNDIVPTVCFYEPGVNTMIDMPEMTATMHFSDNVIAINGTKSCVFNAKKANLFLILAKGEDSMMQDVDYTKRMSIYLVPEESKNLLKKQVPMMGLNGADICTIHFDNVEIPAGNYLSEDITPNKLYTVIFGEGKCFIGAQAIGILKRFLDLLVRQVQSSHSFNNTRETNNSLHEVIARASTALYGIESIVYMTTGMNDIFDKQDTILEQQLVSIYCINRCREAIFHGIQILGCTAYAKGQPFEQLLRDALSITSFDRPILDAKTFAALLGFEYITLGVYDDVKIERNPMFHPFKNLKKAVSLSKYKRIGLNQFVHPTLVTVTESLEISVHDFKTCVQDTLVNNGVLILTKHSELRRLTDMLVEIYAAFAVCARASRSYCIGLRDCDDEINLAQVFAYDTLLRTKVITQEIKDGSWSNGDDCFNMIAETTFNKKKYFASHPMDRTY